MKKTKVCSKCEMEKPLNNDYFGNKQNSKDGYNTQCKVCVNKYSKEYAKNNKEKIRLKNKRWVERNKERLAKERRERYQRNREHELALHREYYKENREEILKKKKLNREATKDERRKYAKQYRENNLEKHRRWEQERRAKKKSLPATLTDKEWEIIKEKFGNECAYCGVTEKEHEAIFGEQLQQEHFVPLSKGGGYTHNNIIPSCRTCNSSKQGSDFFEWYPGYEHYSKDRERFILKFLKYTNGKQQLALFI